MKQFPTTAEKHGPNLQNETSTNKRLNEKKTKVKLVETFIKPILLYGLETAVIRKVDFGKLDAAHFGKLDAALNKTRRMLLKQYSEKKLHKCRNCRKSTFKEYRSGVSCTTGKSLSLNCEAQRRCCQLSSCEKQVYAKDWLRALNLDLERLGIIRKDELMKNMKPLKYNEVDQSTQRMVGSRPQILPCEAGNCSLNFIERKKC